ncbi:hypothetical protein LTR24_006234 [Lithohypha guttulata]|uniref:ARM repeat-containing protein n=1 Tax=Lithohypha guttulata TaxID=1690604 RepID=A0ABR0K6I2_9EURO|nr:hypothetical protein LTR24_006234 [Lithohypha guttulata]
MTTDQDWPLVVDVLQTGPADGRQILQHAETNNVWEALYVASRSSPYAPAWREAFGRQRLSRHGARSILELAVRVLIDQCDTLKPQEPYEQEQMQAMPLLVRLIANCCADNDHNRRTVIHAGGLLPLIKSLDEGADPNVLVPTIYNVCADLEDPAEQFLSDAAASEHGLSITIAEERLARTDVPLNSIYSGILAFLSPAVVLQCNDEIKEYLADLVEMSARPAAAAQEGLADPRDGDFGHPLSRLLAADGGKLLANRSAKCRCNIARSLLAISASGIAKTFLASTGLIFEIALMADYHAINDEYFGEDEGDQKDNKEALDTIKTAMLRLTYEVCQMPQFLSPSKYGIARQSLNIVCDTAVSSSFAQAVSYIVLNGFVDSDVRAQLLVSENLLPPLIEVLAYETDKTVIHPALALATRLAITWPLRAELHQANAMQAVRHLLTAANLGYEIPLNTITFLELLIKGHPIHVLTALDKAGGQSIMDDVHALFHRGHDAICFEIGRLVIEICATLAQQSGQQLEEASLGLDKFASSREPEALARVMVHMATKVQGEARAVADRVWFALGLLSTTTSGKIVVQIALQDADLQREAMRIEGEGGSWAADNVKFMTYNLGVSPLQMSEASTAGLNGAMEQMALG